MDSGTSHPLPRLVAGTLCLDFVNTVDPRHSDDRRDFLHGYDDLVTWARHAEALTNDEARRLLRLSRRSTSGATVYKRAVALREALYSLLTPTDVDDSRREDALAELNAALVRAAAAQRIAATDNGFRWEWSTVDSLERVLWPIVRDAAQLLTSEELSRVRECAGYDGRCGWLFLDTTKNESRRWCSMRDCGNREKARRHYARQRVRRKGATRERDRA